MSMSRDNLISTYPFPMVIDNTMREDWWKCHHYFFRRHIHGIRPTVLDENLEPTTSKSIDLVFGGVLAKGIEVTRKSYANGEGKGDSIVLGASALVKAWMEEEPLPPPMSRGQEAKTLDNALMCHAGYWTEWPLDDPMQQVASINGKAMIEFSGACPIPNCYHPITGEQLLYAGRFDSVLDRFGVLFGLDDKSTGSRVDSEIWRNQWRLRGQFTGYCWLAQSYDIPMNAFLIHGIQVQKTQCKFAEALAERPQWMISQWLAQLETDIINMIADYHAFINNPHSQRSHPFGQALGYACKQYNRTCEYMNDICASPRPDYDRFAVTRWNPLERTEDAT